MPTLRQILRNLLPGRPHGLGRAPAKGALASVSAHASAVRTRVDDSGGWHTLNAAPGDRPWSETFADLEDTLEAWRKNFFIRRIVNVTRSYAVGSGISLSSSDPHVAAFIEDFWTHPKNRIDRRLGPLCDQLTRDGELFPILFTNPVDGMSYLRFKTARQIREVQTQPGDYETELAYVENLVTPKTWYSPNHPIFSSPPPKPARDRQIPSPQSSGIPLPPVMLHFAVNKPIDATRGESDLTPILPWALRYSEWLKDRVRLNRIRTRQGVLDVMVADDTQVETKRQQLRRTNPVEAGIYVHGPGEEVAMHDLNVAANDAEQDGKVLRLAIATGANLGLHYLGEGETTNYATAREMGEPTARFYADRQQDIIWSLEDLVTVAYIRFCQVHGREVPEDLALQVTVTEVARADNESLANAARSIVQALATAQAQGWVDDETALTLALKFAGETLPTEKIRTILAKARREKAGEQETEEPKN